MSPFWSLDECIDSVDAFTWTHRASMAHTCLLIRSLIAFLRTSFVHLQLVAQEARLSKLEKCDCRRSCITPDGDRREENERWEQDCKICRCEKGEIICDKKNCTDITCKNPVDDPDDKCCPKCLSELSPTNFQILLRSFAFVRANARECTSHTNNTPDRPNTHNNANAWRNCLQFFCFRCTIHRNRKLFGSRTNHRRAWRDFHKRVRELHVHRWRAVVSDGRLPGATMSVGQTNQGNGSML